MFNRANQILLIHGYSEAGAIIMSSINCAVKTTWEFPEHFNEI